MWIVAFVLMSANASRMESLRLRGRSLKSYVPRLSALTDPLECWTAPVPEVGNRPGEICALAGAAAGTPSAAAVAIMSFMFVLSLESRMVTRLMKRPDS
jgi:hypothetical protein